MRNMARKNYTQEYIDECSSKVNLLLVTYKDLVKTLRVQVGNNNKVVQLTSSLHFYNVK